MARMARIFVPEYPHHVTQRGVRSLGISGMTRTGYLTWNL